MRRVSQLSGEAGALLSEGGVALTYRGGAGSLLVPGDPELLPLVVLGLLSNAAKNTPRGELVLRLLQRPGQAILLLRQGGALTQRQLDELLTLTSSGPIPLPGQGAGMGLTVIQHIISLHRGALLWRPEMFLSILPLLLGIVLVVAGLCKLQSAVDLVRIHSSRWLWVLLTAVLTLLLGAVTLYNPFSAAVTLMQFIGISLVVSGVSDLAAAILMIRRLRAIDRANGSF